MIRKFALSVLALLALLCAGVVPAAAQTCSAYPFSFTPNTTIRSAQVNSNFASILNCANNSLAPLASPSFTGTVTMGTPLSPANGGTPFFYGLTSTGSANAQVVATTVPANFSLTNGYVICWTSGFNNTTATTLNPNGQGVTTLQKMTSAGLVAFAGGELLTGARYCGQYDGSVIEVWNPSTLGSGTVTSVSDATNGGLNVATGTTTPVLSLKPADLLTKATPTTADSLVIMDAAASNAAKTALISSLPALPGTWTAGSAVTMNPIATASTTSAAHGLSRVDGILAFLINITGEQGYTAGEKVPIAMGDTQGTTTVAVSSDGTNTYITVNGTPVLPSKSSLGTGFTITLANWKVVATPYKIN